MTAMDNKTIVWIKKEETDEVQVSPCNVEVKVELQEDVKQEFPEDPLKVSWPIDCIKQNPEVNLGPHEIENNVQVSPCNVEVKVELQEDMKQEFPEDPLKVSSPTDCIKQDPEVNLGPHEIENNVAASTKYECDSTRFIHIREAFGEPNEETLHRGMARDELETDAEVPTHFIMGGTHSQQMISQQGSSLSQAANFESHSNVHSDKGPYKCDMCDRTFVHWSNLNVHALVHNAHDPYKCDVCDKSFARLHHLKQHLVTHSGKRPHKCDICGKSFSQLSHLKRHTLIHGEKGLNICDVCGKSFALLHNLKRHAAIHTVK